MFVGMIVAGIIYSVFDAIYPLFNKYAITHFVGEKTMDTVVVFVVGHLVIAIVQCVINYINVIKKLCLLLYTFSNSYQSYY